MYKIENHKVSDAARAHTHLDDAGYQRMYKQSLEQPDQFWAEQAERFISWDKKTFIRCLDLNLTNTMCESAPGEDGSFIPIMTSF